MADRLTLLWLKCLAGSPVPARWLYPPVLPRSERAARRGKLHIEIVSHCWQYSALLAYQLGSLIEHPVRHAHVTLTVYHAAEDEATVQLLALAGQQSIDNVVWNWQVLPGEALFRRSIGRNRAALSSTADWVWFTDCDMTFQSQCIDSLNAALQGRQDALVYPAIESKTRVYTEGDLVTRNSQASPELLRADPTAFVARPVDRATGPLQITHGDVARANGYCRDVAFYQAPASHFQKATEDRMFRWLLGTPGEPVEVPGVCRIQHASKGRYREASRWSHWRLRMRRWQNAWRNRSA